ncbi:Exocyst complex component 7 [Portunus trituberculatus]|uniref:Exocyst complex component 7 n=1 Tax=Portunus trituberculatus TaxID=210409 RepID=A0A5B7D1L6_PORTR|nr:Exocyst complex component 7 [Portunus trituberculatus]
MFKSASEVTSHEITEINEETLSGVELVPPGVREDLRAIAAWLDKHNNTDRLTVYAKLRSDTLKQSLRALRDYQRSSSMERGQGTGSLNSPGPLRGRLTKVDSTSKSRTLKISNKAKILQKAITGHVSSRRQGSPGHSSYMHGTLTSPHGRVSALHCLAFAEYLLAQQLVPEDRVTRTFEMILKEPMDQLVTEGEGLATQARKSVSRGDYQAMLSVLAMVRHVTNIQPEYDRLLTNCQTSIRAKFAAIIHMLQETCVKALEGFVDSVKSDGERGLPKDGTVHQITNDALRFTKQLPDYAQTLAPILQRDTVLTSSLSNLPRNADASLQAKALLGAYTRFTGTVDNAQFTLNTRCFGE